MKYTVALLFQLLFFQCHLHKLVSYEQGLTNCNEIQEKLKKDNPGQFHFVGPDCLIGSQIPDFEATSINGQVINREMLKGKVSIINFWFISCAPCVAEIPGFNAIVDKYGTDNINYIAIGRDDEQTITAFLKANPWKFEHIPNENQIIQENFESRWGYPTTFLLNRNAEIVLAFSGGKADSSAVEEIQNKLIPTIEKELKKKHPRTMRTTVTTCNSRSK